MAKRGQKRSGASTPRSPKDADSLRKTAAHPQPSTRWAQGWQAFRTRHREWCAVHYRCDEPLYLLPAQVIDALRTHPPRPSTGREFRKSSLPLKPKEFEAERELAHICRSQWPHAVGVRCDQPILYPLLQEVFERMEERRDLCTQQQVAIELQILGYVGRLVKERGYCDDLQKLQTTWTRAKKPNFFPFFHKGRSNYCGFRGVERRFLMQTQEFMERWMLEELASWDLPVPQRPKVISVEIPGAIPRGHFHVAIPCYFEAGTGDALGLPLREHQRSIAQDLGTPMSCPLTDIAPRRTSGKPTGSASKLASAYSPSDWATRFRVDFIFNTVQQRYRGRRGVISRAEHGVLAWLASLGHTITLERLRRLRRSGK